MSRAKQCHCCSRGLKTRRPRRRRRTHRAVVLHVDLSVLARDLLVHDADVAAVISAGRTTEGAECGRVKASQGSDSQVTAGAHDLDGRTCR